MPRGVTRGMERRVMNTNQPNYTTSTGRVSKDKIRPNSDNSESCHGRELYARPYPSLIPEGEYFAVAISIFRDMKSRQYGERIYVDFQIVGGDYGGTVLRMFLRPSVYPTSNLYRAWSIANEGPPRSRTKLNPRIFVGKLFRVCVATVRPKQRVIGPDGKTRPGDYLPDYLQYSKISYLCSLEITNSPIRDLVSNAGDSKPAVVTNIPTKSFQSLALHEGEVGRRKQEAGNLVHDAEFARGVEKSACNLQPVGDDLNLVADSTPGRMRGDIG